MPASQAGRRGFDPRLPLQLLQQLASSSQQVGSNWLRLVNAKRGFEAVHCRSPAIKACSGVDVFVHINGVAHLLGPALRVHVELFHQAAVGPPHNLEVNPFEADTEVSNYVAALTHGLKRLREGFPLSLRLIREIHEVLLSKGRGSDKTPGEFRATQNWIGGTRPGNAAFVPPPPDRVMECMGQLELFLHEDKAAFLF